MEFSRKWLLGHGVSLFSFQYIIQGHSRARVSFCLTIIALHGKHGVLGGHTEKLGILRLFSRRSEGMGGDGGGGMIWLDVHDGRIFARIDVSTFF